MLRPALFATAACAASLGVTRAETPPGVVTYALVVGSNAAGPGQSNLKYAEDDARRMGNLLVELGGYQAETVDVLVHPTPEAVRARITKLSERVHADLAAGKKSRILFYYSGHARATALDLGNAQLPLAELRTRLFSVPATLTVVVLDACQSGAFSRVKGAAPAADFSWNSRSQLDASGIAVLASSSGSELSQESEQLRSSYFTHHLLVGMRGAGDGNRDGQVSIDEAYRYAYHQTLLATAETAVGGQHVSLEVDLKGHGEVPLSFPRAATASIALPPGIEGKALVSDRRAKAVVAETQKAKGDTVRIAVAPGDYDVIVRQGDKLSRCAITATRADAEVDLAKCTTETVVATTTKGGAVFRPRTRFTVFGTAGGEHRDDYTQTLEDFGYAETTGVGSSLGLAVTRQISSRLWVGGFASDGRANGWERMDGPTTLSIEWNTSTVGVLGQGFLPFGTTGFWARNGIYGQLGLGIAIARTHFVDADETKTREMYFGPALTAGGGYYAQAAWVPALGVTMGYQFDYARAVDNLVGDTHGSGGHRFSLGLSYTY
ncbi:MAG: caspase family protein [Kofleriaceae bacterium]|nr:caspase family protein [Kofleriaceae bacterium]